jgi:SAM-dependent methyltransferase
MYRLTELKGNRFPQQRFVRFFFRSGLQQQVRGNALELGCGNGNNLMLLCQYGWDVTGVDVSRERLAEARANLSMLDEPHGGYRLIQHDLSLGIKGAVEGPFDLVVLFGILYYLPRKAVVGLLRDLRGFLRKGSLVYLVMRTLRDYRYRRGEEVEPNGFRLTIEETGEKGLLNVFYHEYELVGMLREHLSIEAATMQILYDDFQNIQNGVVVSNSDISIWGRVDV